LVSGHASVGHSHYCIGAATVDHAVIIFSLRSLMMIHPSNKGFQKIKVGITFLIMSMDTDKKTLKHTTKTVNIYF